MKRVALLLALIACDSSSGAKGNKWYDGPAPVGVWFGTNVVMNIHDPLLTDFKLEGFVAWPDGHMSLGLPWTGFADFDRDAWERDVGQKASLGGHPGTYKRDGDGWRITYPGGREKTLKLVGEKLKTDRADFWRAKDVTGATLDGLYTWWTDAEHPLLANPGCQPLVSFTKDGHFEDRGGFATPCAAAPDPNAPGSGTYEIRDFSLILHYADGRTAKHLITAPANKDLHSDSANAIIMGQAWQRRTGVVAAANPVAQAPVVTNGSETTFDAVAFSNPPGQAQRNKDSIVFTDSTGDQLQCMTAIFSGVASTGDPASDFAADWKDIVANKRTADSTPAPQKGQSPTGLVFTAGGSMTTESSGTRVYRALLVFEVGGRRVTAMVVAPTEAGLARCRVDDLIRSMRAS